MMKIDHTYVINLKHRPDRWSNINKAFENTGLKLNRWTAVNGKDLSEEYIKDNTSTLCNYICSPGIIGCWLSHYSLWQYIVNNNLDNVLVLEDDAIPVPDFNKKLDEYLKLVPNDWDIILLGCFGSCDDSPDKLSLTRIIGYKNEQVNENIIKPEMPYGLHAYLLSNKGAIKLINNNSLKKVRYHLDNYLASYIFNKEVTMYAVKPYLVYQNTSSTSDNADESHYLLAKMTEGLKVSDQLPVSAGMNIQIIYIRPLGIPVTYATAFLILLVFVINFIPNYYVRTGLLTIIIIYELFELSVNSKSINKTKVKVITFELFFILLISLIFSYMRQK